MKKIPSITPIQKAILRELVGHWKKEFAGLSALTISELLRETHEKVVSEIRALYSLDLVRINENVKLYTLKIGKGVGKEVVTIIAFPSKSILKEQFKKEQFKLDNMDYGYYANQLHQGESQISLRFFSENVLKQYFDQPEKYRIADSVVSGVINTRNQYYLSVPDPESKREEMSFAYIRYGKRKLKGGKTAISVILHDLAGLSKKDQLYWASKEFDKPIFYKKDKNWSKYLKQNFEGQFVDHEDPLHNIQKLIEDTNEIFLGKYAKLLFLHTINPKLSYPLIDNEDEYVRCHEELWKIVASFNEPLLDLLISEWGTKKPGKDIRTFGKFKLLISGVKNNKQICKAFEKSRGRRGKSAHEPSEAKIVKNNYSRIFKEDCRNLTEALLSIKKYFIEKIDKEKDCREV